MKENLIGVLKKLEWSTYAGPFEDDYLCPMCGAEKWKRKHTDNCELAQCIHELENEETVVLKVAKKSDLSE